MKLMEDMTLKEGRVLPGDILKVDSFLNHQLDVAFLAEAVRKVPCLTQEKILGKSRSTSISSVEPVLIFPSTDISINSVVTGLSIRHLIISFPQKSHSMLNPIPEMSIYSFFTNLSISEMICSSGNSCEYICPTYPPIDCPMITGSFRPSSSMISSSHIALSARLKSI